MFCYLLNFDIEALKLGVNDIDVLVTEGVVEVAAEIPPQRSEISTAEDNSFSSSSEATYQRVPAGSAAVYDQSQVKVVEKVSDRKMQQRLAWQQGLLIFSGDPLEKVVAEISRYTDTRIIIKSEEIRQLRIGGQFNLGDTQAVFSALEKGFGIKADYVTNRLVYLYSDNK